MNGSTPMVSERARAARFVLVGGATAAIYFAVLALFVHEIGADYRIAVSVAYVLAICFHFFANRRYTFAAHGTGVGRQVARYVVLLCVNYAIMVGIVGFAVEVLKLGPYVGSLLGAAASTVAGFVLARYWVFRTASPGTRPAA